jgi:hypothetical protein
MQIVHSKNNIVEKVLRDKEGRLVRARFTVYENAGRIKARLLDFVYLDIKELTGKVLAIASKIKEAVLKINFTYQTPTFAFVKIENLEANGTKARAPTL